MSTTIALSVTNWLVRVEIILGRISLRCLLAGRGPQVYSFLGTFGGWRRILISGGEGQTIELVAHLTYVTTFFPHVGQRVLLKYVYSL